MADGRRWGQDATIAPGWARVGEAAWGAARSPLTWAPLAGALAFQVGGADRKVSEWAVEHTPVYGSPERAGEMSSVFLHTSQFLWPVTALLTPGGEEPGAWAGDKARGMLVEWCGLQATRVLVGETKAATGRERPDGSNDESFPSGHAGRVSAADTLAARNVRSMGLPRPAETAAELGLGVMAGATMWGRVEGGAHYPSDVLAGAAVGHFLAAFFHDAFLGLGGGVPPVSLEVEPRRGGATAALTLAF